MDEITMRSMTAVWKRESLFKLMQDLRGWVSRPRQNQTCAHAADRRD
jgi:hypothetical protein